MKAEAAWSLLLPPPLLIQPILLLRAPPGTALCHVFLALSVINVCMLAPLCDACDVPQSFLGALSVMPVYALQLCMWLCGCVAVGVKVAMLRGVLTGAKSISREEMCA